MQAPPGRTRPNWALTRVARQCGDDVCQSCDLRYRPPVRISRANWGARGGAGSFLRYCDLHARQRCWCCDLCDLILQAKTFRRRFAPHADKGRRTPPTRWARRGAQHGCMYSSQSSHVWLCRFSIRLRELRPEIAWERAVACAVRAYGISSDLNPEAVATVHAKFSTAPARPERGSPRVSPARSQHVARPQRITTGS